jgi:serine/threonine-protein phosphatase PGAM5
MSVLYVVIPLALLVVGVAVAAFLWAAKRGQFDDLETPAVRALHDDAPAKSSPRSLRAAAAALSGIAAAGLTAGGAADGADSTGTTSPGGIRYVYLVRHAMYDKVDLPDERTSNGLNALGREQAALIAARIAALPVTMNRFASSDFLRAWETAEIVGKAIGRVAERDSLIEECTSPSSRPGLDAQHDPAEMKACQASMEAAWAKYFVPSPAADAHDLVCHGNVIRWFVNRALGNDVRHWTSLDIGNASLTVISVRPDGSTRLILFSDVGHIPVSKQTWAGLGAGWGAPR